MVAERVAVTGLAESADQHVVARLEEHDARHDPAPFERPAHRPECEARVTGPHVHHDRDACEAPAIRRDQFGQVGQELTGQVVDDGVAEVLEQLGRGGLAATGQAGQDHDRFFRGTVVEGVLRGLGHRPVRLMKKTVPSYSTYIVAPSTNGLTRSPPGVATAEKIAMPRIT